MFESLQEIVDRTKEQAHPFWQVILEEDLAERDVDREESTKRMEATWQAMLSAALGYDKNLKSRSGLVGGDGAKMEEYRLRTEDTLCGDYVAQVIAGALQMGESNACMKRIVAAPTAGSCGVLPAVLVPYYNEGRGTKECMIQALYVAAGIGQVIAHRASISGAAGGCQAEIGAASAMAAGALVHLQGGNSVQIIHAAGMALKNLLGLVCDPVAGLVEVPCVKRNVIGAMNAISAADMALAGIESRIPPDQVIDAMGEVGEKMDTSLKETAMGGLAVTPEGLEIAARFEETTGKNQKSS